MQSIQPSSLQPFAGILISKPPVYDGHEAIKTHVITLKDAAKNAQNAIIHKFKLSDEGGKLAFQKILDSMGSSELCEYLSPEVKKATDALLFQFKFSKSKVEEFEKNNHFEEARELNTMLKEIAANFRLEGNTGTKEIKAYQDEPYTIAQLAATINSIAPQA
jgi:hypothetical protein